MNIHGVAKPYAQADDRRAWLELGITFALYAGCVALALASIGTWWLMLPAMVGAAAMGLRTYMIQHDCIHRAFFTSRWLNDAVGSLLSPITMTPYKATRYIHNQHHNHVSDLDRRDTFEIYTMTLKEWEAAGPGERLRYRLYRSPVTLILLGPFVLYTVLRRFPLYAFKPGGGGLGDLVLHNAMVFGYFGAVWWLTGWAGVAVLLGALYIACLLGALIPYVVHNFEDIHWGTKPELDFKTAALDGSSVLDWGWFFDLVTMNIAYHDLHHLIAKIPGYRLKAAHAELEAKGLIRSKKIGFVDGLRCLRWKLYDEAAGRMVPFPTARAPAAALAAE